MSNPLLRPPTASALSMEPSAEHVVAQSIRAAPERAETLLSGLAPGCPKATGWEAVALWDAVRTHRPELAIGVLQAVAIEPRDIVRLDLIAAACSVMDEALADALVAGAQAIEPDPTTRVGTLEGIALSQVIFGNTHLLGAMRRGGWDGATARTWPHGRGDLLYLACAMLAKSGHRMARDVGQAVLRDVLAMGGNPHATCLYRVNGSPDTYAGVMTMAEDLVSRGHVMARQALDFLLDGGLDWGTLDVGEREGARAIRSHAAWKRQALGRRATRHDQDDPCPAL